VSMKQGVSADWHRFEGFGGVAHVFLAGLCYCLQCDETAAPLHLSAPQFLKNFLYL
jgi:hypothetical protein